MQQQTCSITNCSNRVICHGWCQKHYTRWLRHGDPLYLGKTEDGAGNITDRGYRKIRKDGRTILEHRAVIEEIIGRKLGTYEDVHHKDGNRLNNSPENLELTTRSLHRKHHVTTFRDATHKECTRCHEIKPRKKFYLKRDPRKTEHWDTHMPRCKTCMREIRK